jgi:hypothetical protein
MFRSLSLVELFIFCTSLKKKVIQSERSSFGDCCLDAICWCSAKSAICAGASPSWRFDYVFLFYPGPACPDPGTSHHRTPWIRRGNPRRSHVITKTDTASEIQDDVRVNVNVKEIAEMNLTDLDIEVFLVLIICCTPHTCHSCI